MKFIINADDFGESESTNRTILELHKHGIISSTTVIANSNHYDMAVEISKDNPRLGIGVHLCLDGPFNIGTHYRTILNEKTRQFFDNFYLIDKLKRFDIDGNEIYSEYCLQIEKVMDSGIRISNLDHHHHMHLYLPALNAMIKACKRYKISFIRTQKIILHHNKNIFNKLYRNFHQYYVKRRLNAVDGYFEPGILNDSEYDKYYTQFRSLINKHYKTVEVILH